MIDHWKNDFLITSQKINELEKMLIFEGNNIFCYSGMENFVCKGKISVLILGRIFDIDNLQDDTYEIALKCADHFGTNFFETYLQKMSGRFIILIDTPTKTIIYPDACALLSIYYGLVNNLPVACSSIKLINDTFNIVPDISNEVKKFLNSAIFRSKGCFWIGEQAIDRKYKMLLANNILDYKNLSTDRRSVFRKYDHLSYAEKVETYAQLMVNSLKAVKGKGLMIPITAGIDSRIIYAASKNISLSPTYYLFDNGYNQADIEIGNTICQIGSDKLEIYQELEVQEYFYNDYKQLFYYLTEEDRISHFFHHFSFDSGRMNINGNGGDIIRGYYNYYSMKTPQSILKFIGYKSQRMFIDQLHSWLSELKEETNIKDSDFLYWEQKTCNWFGRYQYEKNFFIDDFSPYSNYKLITLGFSIPFDKRRAYKNTFQLDVISVLYPKIDNIPVNPEKEMMHRIKRKAYSNYTIWVLFNKLRRLFS